ncbi:uncharacterized protein LOC132760642 [Ruditapes philippinarum]|uniref:uncharacterized protein LOC132760642 n=1 Tax=Ruditapes philippinarum TaxID=129788 RepID=UPI00295B7F78|nr:uncharacterized protein LOC132760642 [Ruditapes philippinarum]
MQSLPDIKREFMIRHCTIEYIHLNSFVLFLYIYLGTYFFNKKMLLNKILFSISVLVSASLFAECYTLTFTQPISEGTVNGKKIKFCEYKLTKMLPKSKILDAEARLSCSCSKKRLTCKEIPRKPGSLIMTGTPVIQNPFDKEWKGMVDDLIQSKYVGKYQVLQVKTQVVAGYNTFLKLLVIDRLCDLTIYKNLAGLSEITDDTCSIGED